MNTDSTMNNLITLKELANWLKKSPASIYRLVDKRIFPFYKIGGSLRFARIDIDKYIKNSCVEPMINQYEYTQKRK